MRNKIVVFGGSGFIGSHVADHLSEAGYEVIIYDIKDSLYLRDDQEIVIGDILDFKKVENVTKDAMAVYNFAALADLDEALSKPVQTVEINLLGTIRILEACRKNDVKRFVFASTVYVNSKEGGFYRCSKKAAEEYIQEYHNRYGLDYCILRYGSLYGPRCGEDNGLWQILNNAIKTGKLQYMGHPDSLRDYIHVDNAARASLKALNNDFKNQHIILTGQELMRVLDLLKMIGEILDIKKDIEFQDTVYTGHYIRTPYSYNEKVGKKYIPSMHVDLGQGILQMINEIKNSATDQKD
jgi:UDP-glucose 4-epimerase|tara:strand:- start:5013 stop:5900 length:888 start_codon:yes stop_codon:yes gene_type:complete